MLYRIMSFLLALSFLKTSFAVTWSADKLDQAFSDFQYSLTVEWDQKDKEALRQYTSKFEGELRELRREGLTSTEILNYTRGKFVSEGKKKDFEALLQMSSSLSEEEQSKYLMANMEHFFSKGSSWDGEFNWALGAVILGGWIMFIVAAARGTE